MSIARWLSQEGLFVFDSSNLGAIPVAVLLRHVEQISLGLRACRDPMLSVADGYPKRAQKLRTRPL